MPHVSSGGGDDLGSTDEVKVFKDEGDGEDEKRSSENLTEEKSSLIDLTESEVHINTSFIFYFYSVTLYSTCFCFVMNYVCFWITFMSPTSTLIILTRT